MRVLAIASIKHLSRHSDAYRGLSHPYNPLIRQRLLAHEGGNKQVKSKSLSSEIPAVLWQNSTGPLTTTKTMGSTTTHSTAWRCLVGTADQKFFVCAAQHRGRARRCLLWRLSLTLRETSLQVIPQLFKPSRYSAPM
ncbi:hypothetical protein BaRGS_00009318 [Batillaria attramentaria]|uniref:Uncharacterized protein n=1 Tax=Batillaria attramentaria TaxID=370345 RepID=A0ABD0LIV0_9CAEN